MDFPKVLPPGKAGKIKLEVKTGNAPGEHKKSVTIKSNDPAQPEQIIEISFITK